MLCDLCIIQLNVSYQFKTLAVEIDGKHQQHLIENGINHSPNSDNSTLHSVEQRTLERSAATLRPLTFPVNLSNLHRRVIKSEPTDYEIMSDITIDTNTDLLEDFPRNGVASSASNQPFGASNMVCVSDLELLRSNGDSDSEYISNNLPSSFRRTENPANTVESRLSTTTTTTTTIASKQLVIAATKSTNQSKTVTSDRIESRNTEVVEERISTERTTVLPRKKKSRTVRFADSEVKKSLRPKTNENINYSLVRKRRKHINPVNKVKQNRKIKQESDTIRQLSGRNSHNVNSDRMVVPINSSILRNKRRNDTIEEKSRFPFRRGQLTGNKEQYRENRNVSRRMIIKETDRFRFASIKTFDSVTSTRN